MFNGCQLSNEAPSHRGWIIFLFMLLGREGKKILLATTLLGLGEVTTTQGTPGSGSRRHRLHLRAVVMRTYSKLTENR